MQYLHFTHTHHPACSFNLSFGYCPVLVSTPPLDLDLILISALNLNTINLLIQHSMFVLNEYKVVESIFVPKQQPKPL